MTKPTIAIVNYEFVPIEAAQISILDRGFLFADGVYEVMAVLNGRLIDSGSHLARLWRSLRELRIPFAPDELKLRAFMEELIARESLREGMIYVQITRGAAPTRGFGFPDPNKVAATLVMFVQEMRLLDNRLAATGVKVITIPETRWKRRDIKSIALLPQVLGKQAGFEADAFEAWMVEDGHVTEGTSSSAGIITREGTLVTRPVSNDILESVTRRAIFSLAAEIPLQIEERLFKPEEAYVAAEAFTASATALIMPIVEIDGHLIGDGKPGKITIRLRRRYLEIASGENPDMA
jgi:D-alanine transaminase